MNSFIHSITEENFVWNHQLCEAEFGGIKKAGGVNECDTTIQKLSSEIDKLKAENQELLGDNLIQKQGETIRKLQREVERSHQELSTANKNADKELDTKCEIIRDLEQRLEESKKQGDGQQDEIYRLEDQVKKLNIELTSVQSKVDELQLLVAEKDDKIQYFKKGGHNLGAMNQKIALEAQKVLEMNAKLKETLANTQKDLDAAVQRINKKEELIEDFKKYTEGLRKQQSKDASKIAASDGMIQKLNSEISMLKTKYQEKALEAQIQQTTNKKIYERFSKWRLDVYNTAQ
ncbi:protein lava lamp-like [Saccostrea echinata]|uniref:protein lava lamp-like n=1 Tax=Saccostrea echinata TaxID=191078 RepID=UPI002A7F3BE5|nr:protein lava lamp-like [Saccostrea echinata]